MYIFVALLNAKPKWLALSRDERATFIERVSAKMDVVVQHGVEALCWAENDIETARRAGYEYIGLWQMPDESIVRQFEDILAAVGWYDYFDQANFSGTWSVPEDIVRSLMLL